MSPNHSASLIWSSMMLLKGVITNAEHISPVISFISRKSLNMELLPNPVGRTAKISPHLLAALQLLSAFL